MSCSPAELISVSIEQANFNSINYIYKLSKKATTYLVGNKTARFHQLLTDDIGNPHLTAQINQMVTLFQLSDDMKHMWIQFEKLKQRQNGQLEMPFNFDEKGHTIEPIEETTLSEINKKQKKD